MTAPNVITGSAGSPSAFDAFGPLQFTPPDKFGGKKDIIEEFAFKLRAYLFLSDPGYEKRHSETLRSERIHKLKR